MELTLEQKNALAQRAVEESLAEDLESYRTAYEYYEAKTHEYQLKARDLEEAVQYWTELSQKFEAKLEALETALEEIQQVRTEWANTSQRRIELRNTHHRASKEYLRLSNDSYFTGGMAGGLDEALEILRKHGAIE